MGGNTGNIRTLRNQSGTVGSRTLGSIIASDGINGAGSIRRLYGWYQRRNNVHNFFTGVLGLGVVNPQIKARAQYFLNTVSY